MNIFDLTNSAILSRVEAELWQLRLTTQGTLEVNPGKIDRPDNWFLFHKFYCYQDYINEPDENLETLQAYLGYTDVLDLHRVHAILQPQIPLYQGYNGIPTDKEALEKMIKIWDYLAQYRFANKIEPYIVYGLRSDKHYCPACQNALRKQNDTWTVDCTCCVLRSLWPFTRGCSDNASVFTKWLHRYGTHDATRLAEIIRDTAIEVLAEITRPVR